MPSRYSNLFVSVSTFILTMLVLMPFSVYAQQNEAREDNKDIVAAAKQDAQNNESKFKWMSGGCCLIGTGMAYVAKPTPAKTDLRGKSAEYVETYEQAYESEAKKLRQKSAWFGLLTMGCIGTVSMAVGFFSLVVWAGAEAGR